jgi:Flp pilus assembly protein TadG
MLPIFSSQSVVSSRKRPAVPAFGARLSDRLDLFRRDHRGVAVVEFAVVSPVLMLFLIGAIKFGLAVGQHVMLTHAAANAASTFSLSRGISTPYTMAVSAITSAAPALKVTAIGKVIKVNGTTCATDAACGALLSAGASAQVQVTYACDLSVMGVDFRPNCILTASSSQMVQ